ncbi:MAG: SUMF1/EgtB/PvdO family nonheme iron enzyme, partial [Arcobacter sp.]|nr:SUMF1/EgtB/PvdO family nonheme iron enzyme [Arcobacter sp.]
YPWGNDFDSKKCNNSVGLNLRKTAIVGAFSSYDGDNENSICDISGNVWKWTSSDYSQSRKVIKGGSWYSSHEDRFDSSYDILYKPYDRNGYIGFFLTRTRNT